MGFLFFDNLNGLDFIVHAFSTKPQGFKVAQEALKGLGLEAYDPVVPKQVHGTNVIKVDSRKIPSRPVADGVITKTPGVVLVVKVADCVPIYLVDPRTPAIGLIHAGWRGTSRGIASKAVQRMQQGYGTAPRDLLVALGPSIQKCCYEVGEEVAGKFPEGVRSRKGLKWHLDLAGANAPNLARSGVLKKNIQASPHCTCCEPRSFHSYRRDRRIAGRQYALLALKGGGEP